MKLIMENWKRFLNEDEYDDDVKYAEQELAKMDRPERDDFVKGVRAGISRHLHPVEDEGAVEYVLEKAGMPGAEHLATLVMLFLDSPGILFDITENNPDEYEPLL